MIKGENKMINKFIDTLYEGTKDTMILDYLAFEKAGGIDNCTLRTVANRYIEENPTVRHSSEILIMRELIFRITLNEYVRNM